MKLTRKKRNNLLLSIGSLFGVAAINYTLIHNPIVLLLSFILFIHELGHFIIAKIYGADVFYPIFIPFIFFTLGITRIDNLSDKFKDKVALAGSLFASLTLTLVIFFNLIIKIYSTKLLFLILLSEILFNFIGSDGKRYRKAKQDKKFKLISL